MQQWDVVYYEGFHFTATTQSMNRSYSQRTYRTAGMWAEGWAALWNKPCTASWHSGCPAGTHPCSGQDSHHSQTLPWLDKQTLGSRRTSTALINLTEKKHQCRTSVSVCWRKLRTTCRFHPRFHVSRQNHRSFAGPGELWETAWDE